MLIVPDFVRILIVAYWDAVLNWLSAAIYADLVKHAADHFLVALQTTLDFAPQDTACAAFHHADDPGAPPTHPVPQLVRVLLISYCFNWSLRQLEFQIRFNLLLKWFAGYPLFAVGPITPPPTALNNGLLLISTALCLTRCSARSIGTSPTNVTSPKSAIPSR